MLEVKDYSESQCGCEVCVSMCERIPCAPLPEEVSKLDTRRLLLNYFDRSGGIVEYLQPAGVGHEMKEVGFDYVFSPHRCVFLTDDGKCELHGKCKPWVGRVATCDKDTYPEGHEDTVLGLGFSDRMSELLFEAWNTEEGRRVVEKWKRDVS